MKTRLVVFAAIAAMSFLFVAQRKATAQTQTCAVGARVRVEMVDNAVGTITEIGTEPPHVGWYRIVFESNIRAGNPKGDWFSPKNREIVVEGTNTKCGREATSNQDGCPMSEPPGKVTKSSPASAQLFKRVIYETMAGKVGGASISAPKQIGLTFLEFEMGRAYKNTLTANRIGDRRLHDGAPVGAMIYPVKTKHLRCELYDRSINRWVIQQNYACFKGSTGDWECPWDGGRKVLEQTSIPVR